MSPLYTVFRPHDIDTTYLEHFFKCGYWYSFMNFNGDSGARSDRFSIKDDVFFQRMKTLAAQRAEIVKQMRRKDAPPELADQRMALTCKIAELRKEDKIAEGAIKRIQRTRESNRIDRENRMPLHPRPRRRRREQERECTDTTASVLPWA